MKKKLFYIILSIAICYLVHLYAQTFTFIDPNRDLLVVSRGGVPESIADLIKVYGADINTTNENQQTPLMLAASEDHRHTVERLLDFQPQLDLQDKNGNTAIIIAIDPSPHERITKNSHIIVQRLLEYGANPLIKNFAGKTALDYVTTKKTQDEWATKTKDILLHYIPKFL